MRGERTSAAGALINGIFGSSFLFALMVLSAFLSAVVLPPPARAGALPASNVTVGGRVGDHTGEGFLDVVAPIARTAKGVAFINPRFSLADEDANEVNIGLGYRQLGFNDKAILGGNVYFDSRESVYGNRFNQVGFGLEMLTDWVDARANYYYPESKKELINSVRTEDVDRSVSRSTSSRTSFGDPFGTGHSIKRSSTTRTTTTTTTKTVTTRRLFEQFESGRKGFDAEVGLKLPLPAPVPQTRLFAGYYDFEDEFDQEIKGAKGRIEVRAAKWLTLDGEIFEDKDFNGTDYFAGLRVHSPFSLMALLKGQNPFGASAASAGAAMGLAGRMVEQVIRDVRVQTDESEFLQNVGATEQEVDIDVDKKTRVSSGEETIVDKIVVVADGDDEPEPVAEEGAGVAEEGGEVGGDETGGETVAAEDAVTEHVDEIAECIDCDYDPSGVPYTAEGTFEDRHDTIEQGVSQQMNEDFDIVLVGSGFHMPTEGESICIAGDTELVGWSKYFGGETVLVQNSPGVIMFGEEGETTAVEHFTLQGPGGADWSNIGIIGVGPGTMIARNNTILDNTVGVLMLPTDGGDVRVQNNTITGSVLPAAGAGLDILGGDAGAMLGGCISGGCEGLVGVAVLPQSDLGNDSVGAALELNGQPTVNADVSGNEIDALLGVGILNYDPFHTTANVSNNRVHSLVDVVAANIGDTAGMDSVGAGAAPLGDTGIAESVGLLAAISPGGVKAAVPAETPMLDIRIRNNRLLGLRDLGPEETVAAAAGEIGVAQSDDFHFGILGIGLGNFGYDANLNADVSGNRIGSDDGLMIAGLAALTISDLQFGYNPFQLDGQDPAMTAIAVDDNRMQNNLLFSAAIGNVGLAAETVAVMEGNEMHNSLVNVLGVNLSTAGDLFPECELPDCEADIGADLHLEVDDSNLTGAAGVVLANLGPFAHTLGIVDDTNIDALLGITALNASDFGDFEMIGDLLGFDSVPGGGEVAIGLPDDEGDSDFAGPHPEHYEGRAVLDLLVNDSSIGGLDLEEVFDGMFDEQTLAASGIGDHIGYIGDYIEEFGPELPVISGIAIGNLGGGASTQSWIGNSSIDDAILGITALNASDFLVEADITEGVPEGAEMVVLAENNEITGSGVYDVLWIVDKHFPFLDDILEPEVALTDIVSQNDFLEDPLEHIVGGIAETNPGLGGINVLNIGTTARTGAYLLGNEVDNFVIGAFGANIPGLENSGDITAAADPPTDYIPEPPFDGFEGPMLDFYAVGNELTNSVLGLGLLGFGNSPTYGHIIGNTVLDSHIGIGMAALTYDPRFMMTDAGGPSTSFLPDDWRLVNYYDTEDPHYVFKADVDENYVEDARLAGILFGGLGLGPQVRLGGLNFRYNTINDVPAFTYNHGGGSVAPAGEDPEELLAELNAGIGIYLFNADAFVTPNPHDGSEADVAVDPPAFPMPYYALNAHGNEIDWDDPDKDESDQLFGVVAHSYLSRIGGVNLSENKVDGGLLAVGFFAENSWIGTPMLEGLGAAGSDPSDPPAINMSYNEAKDVFNGVFAGVLNSTVDGDVLMEGNDVRLGRPNIGNGLAPANLAISLDTIGVGFEAVAESYGTEGETTGAAGFGMMDHSPMGLTSVGDVKIVGNETDGFFTGVSFGAFAENNNLGLYALPPFFPLVPDPPCPFGPPTNAGYACVSAGKVVLAGNDLHGGDFFRSRGAGVAQPPMMLELFIPTAVNVEVEADNYVSDGTAAAFVDEIIVADNDAYNYPRGVNVDVEAFNQTGDHGGFNSQQESSGGFATAHAGFVGIFDNDLNSEGGFFFDDGGVGIEVDVRAVNATAETDELGGGTISVPLDGYARAEVGDVSNGVGSAGPGSGGIMIADNETDGHNRGIDVEIEALDFVTLIPETDSITAGPGTSFVVPATSSVYVKRLGIYGNDLVAGDPPVFNGKPGSSGDVDAQPKKMIFPTGAAISVDIHAGAVSEPLLGSPGISANGGADALAEVGDVGISGNFAEGFGTGISYYQHADAFSLLFGDGGAGVAVSGTGPAQAHVGDVTMKSNTLLGPGIVENHAGPGPKAAQVENFNTGIAMYVVDEDHDSDTPADGDVTVGDITIGDEDSDSEDSDSDGNYIEDYAVGIDVTAESVLVGQNNTVDINENIVNDSSGFASVSFRATEGTQVNGDIHMNRNESDWDDPDKDEADPQYGILLELLGDETMAEDATINDNKIDGATRAAIKARVDAANMGDLEINDNEIKDAAQEVENGVMLLEEIGADADSDSESDPGPSAAIWVDIDGDSDGDTDRYVDDIDIRRNEMTKVGGTAAILVDVDGADSDNPGDEVNEIDIIDNTATSKSTPDYIVLVKLDDTDVDSDVTIDDNEGDGARKGGIAVYLEEASLGSLRMRDNTLSNIAVGDANGAAVVNDDGTTAGMLVEAIDTDVYNEIKMTGNTVEGGGTPEYGMLLDLDNTNVEDSDSDSDSESILLQDNTVRQAGTGIGVKLKNGTEVGEAVVVGGKNDDDDSDGNTIEEVNKGVDVSVEDSVVGGGSLYIGHNIINQVIGDFAIGLHVNDTDASGPIAQVGDAKIHHNEVDWDDAPNTGDPDATYGVHALFESAEIGSDRKFHVGDFLLKNNKVDGGMTAYHVETKGTASLDDEPSVIGNEAKDVQFGVVFKTSGMGTLGASNNNADTARIGGDGAGEGNTLEASQVAIDLIVNDTPNNTTDRGMMSVRIINNDLAGGTQEIRGTLNGNYAGGGQKPGLRVEVDGNEGLDDSFDILFDNNRTVTDGRLKVTPFGSAGPPPDDDTEQMEVANPGSNVTFEGQVEAAGF